MKKHNQMRILYSNYRSTGRPTGTAIKGNLSVHLAVKDDVENRTAFRFKNMISETIEGDDTQIEIDFADGSKWTGNTEDLQKALTVKNSIIWTIDDVKNALNKVNEYRKTPLELSDTEMEDILSNVLVSDSTVEMVIDSLVIWIENEYDN